MNKIKKNNSTECHPQTKQLHTKKKIVRNGMEVLTAQPSEGCCQAMGCYAKAGMDTFYETKIQAATMTEVSYLGPGLKKTNSNYS